ncbi:hypothetical protein BS47DRAFT_1331340 [Hydnum rufescens UP504]|uniref:chorismate mutase n=1 Tax=Hydnum rufescens UP504 TaxID=1448309 RepID=A0A9P6DTU5_9AGAM|nr:hypothetical protein BS47DRAFT_1331340 [Hydnum rufescens UP504]
MLQNFVTQDDPLNLDNIRATLTRLEDTIIFALIERAQFALNPRMYERGAFKELVEQGFDGTWLEWFLQETETFHAKARRYTSPDEHPFTKNLPDPIIPPLSIPHILHPNNINANPSILSFYTRAIVPLVTRHATRELASLKRSHGKNGPEEFEDDGNYGSAAIADVSVLQVISRRVHYGKFVSESKFRSDPASFVPHILKPNPAALEALITKPAVERALLARIGKKTSIYGPELGPDGELPARGSIDGNQDGKGETNVGKWRVDVESVRELYESWIIPLTKEVEVEYLLHRLDDMSDVEIADLLESKDVAIKA